MKLAGLQHSRKGGGGYIYISIKCVTCNWYVWGVFFKLFFLHILKSRLKCRSAILM